MLLARSEAMAIEFLKMTQWQVDAAADHFFIGGGGGSSVDAGALAQLSDPGLADLGFRSHLALLVQEGADT